MNWSDIIKGAGEGLFGERLSVGDISNKTGISRTALNFIKSGVSESLRASTIQALEDCFNVKFNATDPKNITFTKYDKVENKSGSRLTDTFELYESDLHQAQFYNVVDPVDERKIIEKAYGVPYKSNTAFAVIEKNGNITTSERANTLFIVDKKEKPENGKLAFVRLKTKEVYILDYEKIDSSKFLLYGNTGKPITVNNNDVELIAKVVYLVWQA